jgi:hypothetical protein
MVFLEFYSKDLNLHFSIITYHKGRLQQISIELVYFLVKCEDKCSNSNLQYSHWYSNPKYKM